LNATNNGSVPAFSGLQITKPLDKSSPLLVLDCAQGIQILKVTLTLRDQAAPQVEFYKITLQDVTITSVTTDGNSADPRPFETVTFSFQKIAWQYQPVDSNGSPVGSPVQSSFSFDGKGI
jgi:type VI secretion system secreted protein Hcp